jgi:hypothetical protein
VDVVERVAFDMESDISRAFSKKRKKTGNAQVKTWKVSMEQGDQMNL